MKLPEFNLKSTDHMSLILFGGMLEVDSVEPVFENGEPVFIKSGEKKGQLKVKKCKIEVPVRGFGLKPLSEWKAKKEGRWKSNEEVLSLIAGAKNV